MLLQYVLSARSSCLLVRQLNTTSYPQGISVWHPCYGYQTSISPYLVACTVELAAVGAYRIHTQNIGQYVWRVITSVPKGWALKVHTDTLYYIHVDVLMEASRAMPCIVKFILQMVRN